MLTQAILIGLIAAFGKFDCQLGTLYAFRPIVLCPLVGLVLVKKLRHYVCLLTQNGFARDA